MESQCVGLAERLGLTPTIKRISPRFPWSFLPPQLWATPFLAAGPAGDKFNPPWPDIVIATGRQTVALALAIKKANPATFSVQIQNPTMALNRFNIVIAPEHDQLVGDNVVSTSGALHRVTEQRLESAREEFSAEYEGLSKPLLGVLIGGTNQTFQFTAEKAKQLASLLREAVNTSGGSLIITPSRRTDCQILKFIKEGLPDVGTKIWDGKRNNPYFGILAHADALIVTGDSVNMVSEAIATGKPVHIFQLSGGNIKFERFHKGLQELGKTRPFQGRIEHWQYPGTDDMTIAADAVEEAWASYRN
jgi:hypothetical protein